MTASNNINLKINKGESLSFAIDRQLDKELGVDVKLGINEWTSVFNAIKSDQVAENKSKFDANDTDVKNGRHFIVQAGENYQITRGVWQKIVNIAKEKMGLNSPQNLSSAETPAETKEPALSSEQKVSQILEEANLNVSEADYLDILNKYENILAFTRNNSKEISDEKIAERLVNYAKGLQFHNKETQFAEVWTSNQTTDAVITNEDVQSAMASGDMEQFKQAFHTFAKEYIELYDNAEGDGKIDVQEFIAMEEKELGRALTEEEKAIVQQEAVNRVAILDRNRDNVLDENEIAAYLWATSKINDGNDKKSAQDITFDEWVTAQEGMGILSGTDLSDEQWKTVNNAFTIIGKSGKTLNDIYNMNDLSELNLNADDKAILEEALPLLEANGFNQEMIDKYTKFDQALENGYNGLKN